MEPLWLKIARGEIGVKEVVGPKGSNPRIEEYQLVAGTAQDDDVPWCSSFINWCMEQAGYPITHSGAARSWLRYGVSVGPTPPIGAITVLFRGDPKGPHGHVGFFVGAGVAVGTFMMLGGNQQNRVCIHAYPVSRVLDYRWPREI